MRSIRLMWSLLALSSSMSVHAASSPTCSTPNSARAQRLAPPSRSIYLHLIVLFTVSFCQHLIRSFRVSASRSLQQPLSFSFTLFFTPNIVDSISERLIHSASPPTTILDDPPDHIPTRISHVYPTPINSIVHCSSCSVSRHLIPRTHNLTHVVLSTPLKRLLQPLEHCLFAIRLVPAHEPNCHLLHCDVICQMIN